MLNYIVLGIIQGITEFFPVSSSAHLVIAQKLLGMAGEELVISIVLHLGTALALVVFFFKDILKTLRDAGALFFIIIVTIITGIIGITGKDFFERLFASPKLIAIALAFTGIILILTRRVHARRNILGIADALVLGLTQGLAIIPGISRSGMTISTLLFRQVDRETSFRFSFLASLPAVFGAALLKAKEINSSLQIEPKSLVFGFLVSFVTGIFSLWVLKIILRRAKLYYFGYYCIAMAVFTLIFIK